MLARPIIRYFLLSLSLFLAFIAGLFVNLRAFYASIDSIKELPVIGKSSDLNLSSFEEAYNLVKRNYYGFDTIDKKELSSGMIRGFVAALWDKHSEYFNNEEKQKFEEMLSGDFEGIGAVVDSSDFWILVKQVLAGSPAKQSGVLQWDIITHVNKESLEGLSLTDAIKKIRGKAWTVAELEILRAGEKAPIMKSVVRNHIEVPSINGKMIEGTKTAYITLSVFGEKTAEQFKETYTSLRTQWADSIILDLRDNGGGYLQAAVDILSEFIAEGKPLVTTKEKNVFLNQTYVSEGKKNLDIPMVVLVNENSASASEITAGALKDYKLALIVGDKTYGKWSVQQPFNLSDGGEIKITVAKWYTPLDHGIDKIGIEPDITVSFLKEDYEKQFDRQLDEAKKYIGLLKKSKIDAVISDYKANLEKEKASTLSGAIDMKNIKK